MKYVLFFLLLVMASPAHAISQEENSDGTTRTITDYIAKYVDVPKGATDWKVFGKTKEIDILTKDKDGMDLQYYKPEFPAAVKALDGQQITVKGFMFPLEEDDNQHEFLFGPFPVSCPFHYHVGPSLVLEAHTDKKHPVAFSYDPITLTGKLELVKLDTENSVFYRLNDAKIVK